MLGRRKEWRSSMKALGLKSLARSSPNHCARGPRRLLHHAPREVDGASSRRRVGHEKHFERPTSKASGPQQLRSERFGGGRLDGRQAHGPNVRHCGKRHHAGHEARVTVDGTPLCAADGGEVQQLQRGEGDVQSREGRLGDAHGPSGSAQRSKEGTWRLEDRVPRGHRRGFSACGRMRGSTVVAHVLWLACRAPGQRSGSLEQGYTTGHYTAFLDTLLGQVFLSNSCKPVRVPIGVTFFARSYQLVRPALVLGTSRRSHHHGCTRGLGQSFQKRSCKLRVPHRSRHQNSQRCASRVPDLQDGDLQRSEMLSCSSWNVSQKVFSSRPAGAGRTLSAPCSAEIWHCSGSTETGHSKTVSIMFTEICP